MFKKFKQIKLHSEKIQELRFLDDIIMQSKSGDVCNKINTGPYQTND